MIDPAGTAPPSKEHGVSANSKSSHIVAGAFGNILEWYDFAVFGFLAPVIADQFFPAHDSLAGLIRVYGVFAAGYLMRPLGGMIFGHIGDRVGRKRALELSILMMALPTFLVGVLPTYAQIGTWAALLLIGLRLVQGVSIGGELIGSISYIVEMAPPGKRGFHGSWTLFTATGGILLGSLLVMVLRNALGDEAMAAWAWRVPFLLGIAIAGAGLWLRMGLPESDVFEASSNQATRQSPVVEALREARGAIAHLSVLLCLFAAGFYILFVWMPTYYTDILEPPVPHAYAVNSLAMVALLTAIPVAGALSDRFGRRRVLLTGMILTGFLSYPLFLLIDTGVAAYALAAQVIFAVVIALNQGPIPAYMAEMFPTRIRSSAIGIAYNVTVGVLGGTAPLVSTWLISETGNMAAPAFYLIGLALVSATALLLLRVKQGEPLS
ncbi:MAG TPA: MFS transporter [Myxococcales bacterium]|nr:MFS transporter [Myxococcales bacterium]